MSAASPKRAKRNPGDNELPPLRGWAIGLDKVHVEPLSSPKDMIMVQGSIASGQERHELVDQHFDKLGGVADVAVRMMTSENIGISTHRETFRFEDPGLRLARLTLAALTRG